MKDESRNLVANTEAAYINLFNALPGNNLLLRTDAPHFTIVAATPQFVKISNAHSIDPIGKSVFEAFTLSSEDSNDTGNTLLLASLDHVLSYKEAHNVTIQQYRLSGEKGHVIDRYWRVSNSPVLNDEENVAYIILAADETTDLGKGELRDDAIDHRKKAYELFRQAPVAVCIVQGPSYIVELANEEMLQALGRTEAMIGKPLIESLPEAGLQGLIGILDQVRGTGAPYHITNFPAVILINGVRETRYFDLVFKPYFENPDDAQPNRIFCVAHNITEQVMVRKEVQQSEQRLRSLVESAPFPIGVYVGREMRIELVNQAIIDVWGKGPDIIGKQYSEVLPELGNQAIYPQLDAVFTTGIPFNAKNQRVDLMVDGRLQSFYFNYSFTPLFDADGKVYGVMNTAAEVTDLVLAKQNVEQSERNFRSMILQSPVAMCILLGPEHVVDIANDAMIDLWGKNREAVMQKPIFDALPDVREQGLEQVFAGVYQTGEPFKANERPVKLLRSGHLETVYQNFVYEPYKDAEGSTLGVLAVSIDVTAQVLARRAIEASREELQLAIEIAELGTFQIDLTTGIGSYSQRVKNWFDFEKEKEQLDAIFSAIYPEDQQQVITAIQQTQASADDSRHDVTYRVVNAAEGTVRHLRSIGKTFFDQRGQAYEIRGVILDVTPQVKYQMQIKENEAVLKQRVMERTFELEQANQELKRSNENLEEFAYAASHDMKEPIRKIHFFADRLKQELTDSLSEEQKRLFGRMEHAAGRMNMLIEDLLTYSHVSRGATHLELVNLNQKVKNVLEDLELEIEHKHATVTADLLPTIKGHKRQMQQLFQNLISNALKYSKPEIPPHIHITARQAQGAEMQARLRAEDQSKHFYLIEVRDNGIGFNQDDAERIFNVFTRLHGNLEYKGTGVGLSIARKVVENHGGSIWAESTPGEGATFKMLLPVD